MELDGTRDGFFPRLERRCREVDSLLCVGLDPRQQGPGALEAPREVLEHNRRIIEATLPFAACYKPNIAFYEAYGSEGLEVLRETLSAIPPEIPVVLDAKRNDIGQTAVAYARALFEVWGVDAVTLNPYLGRESIAPFLSYPGKGLFLLCRTSNPESGDLQGLSLACGRPLFMEVAREVQRWSAEPDRIALVIGATDTQALARVRRAHPGTWILCPGIGAQGGDLEAALRCGLRQDGLGLLAVVGRDIYQAADPAGSARTYRDRIRGAATALNTRTPSGVRRGPAPALARIQTEIGKLRLLEAVLDYGCLRFGAFRLKSGAISPHYLDLRRIISSPTLLEMVASAYAEMLSTLSFDRIAAVPVAAVPIAAVVSLKLGVPFLYPRLVDKGHGSGNRIEGDYHRGERVVLLDDVISSAQSKLEAIEVLEAEGLEVADLVVLVDRESGGREEVERRGVRFQALARISELLALAHSRGQGGQPPASSAAEPLPAAEVADEARR
jgi:uridine monophosphate synthetase